VRADDPAVGKALAYHNARLLAWRDLGVPVRGAWRVGSAGFAFLDFACEACDCAVWGCDHGGSLYLPGITSARSLRARMTAEERLCGKYTSHEGCGRRPAPCEHLAPMLPPWPSHLRTLTQLLLLETAGATP